MVRGLESSEVVRPGVAYHSVKRIVDVVLSLGVLCILGPVCLIVAVLIKIQDGGPVLFWQKRVGMGGRLFWFPKFRSMICEAEKLLPLLARQNGKKRSVTFKLANDPRITRIGRFLRKSSVDELPQIWCVLKGDMSLVGPRPPLPNEVECYHAYERRRLDVVPGLTCLWQVMGRSDLPFEDQVELDLEYIRSPSHALDARILLWTVPAVLSGKGAY